MMKVGLVGMPNAGKSSLFNALQPGGRGSRELPVHDDRAQRRRRAGQGRADGAGRGDRRRLQHRLGHDRVPRHRRPGRRRVQGRGPRATSSWPTSASATRCCTSCAATPTRTSSTRRARSTRRADIETIETELLLADLDSAERRHARVVRDARSGDRAAVAEEAWLRQVIEALQAGKPARTVPVPHDAPDAAAQPVPADRQARAVRRQRQRGRGRGAERRRRPRRRHRRRRRWRSPPASRPTWPTWATTRRRR